MSVLKIITWPAQVLETKAEDVQVFDQDLKKLVVDMHDTMNDADAIGLAANQINIAKRVLVLKIPYSAPRERGGEDLGDEDGEEDLEGQTKSSRKKQRVMEERCWWHDKPMTFINPVILEKRGTISYVEGCLSFPEIFEGVDRAAYVKVKAMDERGVEFEVEAEGIFSVCLQHEIDHIDGIVFFKRMSRLKAKSIQNKMLKRERLK
ncbi:MAG: peptide deformylase [Oligoflexales bacterium]|nr:peptide deformylase [Oligoflexales bacterium]